ncbi:MAG: hypothetical protein ABSG35_11250 [Syntrophobacteraceae bacterium]
MKRPGVEERAPNHFIHPATLLHPWFSLKLFETEAGHRPVKERTLEKEIAQN